MIQRKPAYKLWISELGSGSLQQEPGEFGMHYLMLKDKKKSAPIVVCGSLYMCGQFRQFWKREVG